MHAHDGSRSAEQADTIQQYIDDATRAGDNELADFLKEIQQGDRQRTQRAKELLGARLSGS